MSLATLMPPGGAFFGPDSSVNNQLLRFDGTDGDTGKVAPLTYIGDDGHMRLGKVSAPRSMFEIWDDDAHPILSITAAHDTDYDPQIQFRTDATDTVKFSMGVDGADDCFKINSGTGIGGTTEFVIDINGNVKHMKADPYQNSDTNFFLGVGAGGAGNLAVSGSEGTQNIAIGKNALYTIGSGWRNVIIGMDAGYSLTSAQGCVAIGDNALHSATTNGEQIAIGTHALYSATGIGNIGIGYVALGENTGNHNIGIGNQSMRYNNAGQRNIAIGYLAGYGTSGQSFSNNIFIGYDAGRYIRTGGYNVGIGETCLRSITTGTYNTGLAINSLYSLTTGQSNLGIGWNALFYNVDGDYNVAIGQQAGNGTSGQSQTNNVFIGYQAGLVIGASGDNNVLIGYKAGDNLTTGSNNFLIGYDIDAQSATGNNQLSIGNLIFGTGLDGTGTTPSAGNIGIREPLPETLLELTSTVPYTTWHNSTEEDSDGGRESILWFSGEQSGGEETHLASMTVAHDGAADDQKGYIAWATNDGTDDDAPTERMRIDSAGLIDLTTDLNIATGKVYKINNAQIVGAQEAHIADADGTIEDITTKFNTLLSYLDADAGHGLLAGA